MMDGKKKGKKEDAHARVRISRISRIHAACLPAYSGSINLARPPINSPKLPDGLENFHRQCERINITGASFMCQRGGISRTAFVSKKNQGGSRAPSWVPETTDANWSGSKPETLLFFSIHHGMDPFNL